MKELNPERAASTSVGFLNSIYYLAVALTANGAGALMDRYRDQAVATPTALVYPPAAYGSILTLCLVLAALAAVSALFIRESCGACVFQPRQATPAQG